MSRYGRPPRHDMPRNTRAAPAPTPHRARRHRGIASSRSRWSCLDPPLAPLLGIGARRPMGDMARSRLEECITLGHRVSVDWDALAGVGLKPHDWSFAASALCRAVSPPLAAGLQV